MLSAEVKSYIDKSVLCWLATTDRNYQPNVFPKEIFTYFDNATLIIANIASPQTVKNILQSPKVCVSFVEIFIQKGFQIKGTASIVRPANRDFKAMEGKLLEMTGGNFPFATITAIEVESVKPIIAPRYLLYSETTEEAQIDSAKKAYGCC